MSIEIRPATSIKELDAVYRFRYSIYVEEMGRRQRYADHKSRCIIDPLDEGCYILAAWEHDQIVATVRNNHLADGLIGEYMHLYALTNLPLTIVENSTITTRLMVAPHLRRTTLAVRILCALYEYGLCRGVTDDFMDCNTPLLPLFTGFGYRIHRSDVIHPEYGAVTVMRLELGDIAHLESIRSPLSRVYRKVVPETLRYPAVMPELAMGGV